MFDSIFLELKAYFYFYQILYLLTNQGNETNSQQKIK